MTSEDLKKITENIYINISSEWLLDRLKDRYRWPFTYSNGQPSVEVILENGSKTNNLFLPDGYVNSDLVIDAYNKGYTVLLSRVQRIHPDVLNLGIQTDKYCGQEVNMNIYFGKGTSSVSFVKHTHEYAVLVKSVEGESEWVIGEETKILKDQEAIYFDAYVPHAVTKIVKSKLTITCNLIGYF